MAENDAQDTERKDSRQPAPAPGGIVPAKPFTLLVKPAGPDCNLACTYCFYRDNARFYPGHAKHRMSEETLEALISQAMGERFPQTTIGWQGGEPTLMGVDFFQAVVELERRFGLSGQAVSNSIQTNGLLLDNTWMPFLKKYSFLIGLSLDGPKDAHEKWRGSGSYDGVIRALELMRRSRVQFNILTVVSSSNVHRAREVYYFLRELGVRFMQFIPCVDTPEPAAAVEASAYGDFLCEIFDCWKEDSWDKGGNVSDRTIEAVAARYLGVEPGVCTFGSKCDSYLMVEHDGSVYPCDFFGKPEFRLGYLLPQKDETIAEGATGLRECAESPGRAKFAAAKARKPGACEGCKWWRICRGGCLLARLLAGDMHKDKTLLCEGYKKYFAHTERFFVELARNRARQLSGAEGEPRPAEPAARAPVGRNDPCPCGSGKKYKNCCGRKK